MLKYVGFSVCFLVLVTLAWVAGSFGCLSSTCGGSMTASAYGYSGYASAAVYASSAVNPGGYWRVWSSTSSANAYDSGTYQYGLFSTSNAASGGTGYFASAYINGECMGMETEACDTDS